jgi:hypothetical protein
LLFIAGSPTLTSMGLIGVIVVLILVFFVLAWTWKNGAAR